MIQNDGTLLTKNTKSEVLYGLSSFPRRLPSKLFYDKKGSELFERICELEEYYLTRTELEIMKSNISDIASLFAEDTVLIEPGSGSSKKTRLLFDNIPQLKAYIPIDISNEYLMETSSQIKADYPKLNLMPLCMDYTNESGFGKLPLPEGKRIVYYPGSTIGNFEPHEAKDFLRRISELSGPHGGLLIGVDLKKHRSLLYKAYNDSEGITAAFNLNILERLNREFAADFRAEHFRHKAVYNEKEGRIEMYLISLRDQDINLCGNKIHFSRWEYILTEYSYKYTVDEFRNLIKDYFKLEKCWSDKDRMFSIQFYRTA